MKRLTRVAIPVVVALVAASCGSDDATTGTTSPPPPTSSPAPATTPSTSDRPDPRPVQPVAMSERALSTAAPDIAGTAIAAFGYDVYAATAAAAPAADNVVISPLSIAIALGMLEPGATGEARAQLRDLLLIDDPAAWHDSMNALEQELEGRKAALPSTSDDDSDPGELHTNVANAAFIQPGYPFDQTYLDTIGTNYGAVIEQLDFLTDQAAAADRINEFIADATDDRITDLVGENDIDPDTVLALVNALLLQASWQQEFDAEATVDDDFTRRDGTTVTVPMMNGRSNNSGSGDGWVAASKRLVGDISLEVVLPDDGRFDEIAARFEKVLADYRSNATGGAQLGVPRFETRVTTGLTDILKAMGLTAPFDNGSLLGIADDERLVVDKVLHETWLSVDETGIEAAAATVVLVMATSAPVDEPVPVILDRPFLFRIVDDVSGATMFIGRITDPTA